MLNWAVEKNLYFWYTFWPRPKYYGPRNWSCLIFIAYLHFDLFGLSICILLMSIFFCYFSFFLQISMKVRHQNPKSMFQNNTAIPQAKYAHLSFVILDDEFLNCVRNCRNCRNYNFWWIPWSFALVTPARTYFISGQKSRVLKSTFLK